LEKLHDCIGTVYITNLPAARYISVTERGRTDFLAVEKDVEDGDEKWDHEEEPFTVKTNTFLTALEKACSAETEYVSLTLNRDENRIVVAGENVAYAPLTSSRDTVCNSQEEFERTSQRVMDVAAT
jgi:hypothetical protein